MKNHSKRTLQLFCAKIRAKNDQIFEKWNDFQNRSSCKGYSPSKRLWPLQNGQFGSKIKNAKMIWKFILKQPCMDLFWQKAARKTTQYSRNKTILKIGNLAKAIAHAKPIAFANCKMVSLGQNLKMPKTWKNLFYKKIRVVLCKKTARKNTKYSRNEMILKIGHFAKAIEI